MFIPFLVAGLVLRLTSGWFSGQHTVGDVLLIVCAVMLVLQIIVGGAFFAFWKRFS